MDIIKEQIQRLKRPNKAKRFANWAHHFFVWPAAFACICWLISGFLHPLMTWVGPQPKQFRAPAIQSVNYQAEHIAKLIPAQQNALLIKLVASDQGALLQVTQHADQPRAYYQLDTGQHLPNQDEQQARWLASYYTGIAATNNMQIEYITEYTAEYPWVNRLLPVYRVAFNDEAQHVAFIYTETNALASLSNTTRTTIQSIFRALHTWHWLEPLGIARVFIIGYLMLALLSMSLSGFIYLITRAWRKMPSNNKWHRATAYAVTLPLFMWSFSGFYHLLTAEYANSQVGVSLTQPLKLQQVSAHAIKQVLNKIQNAHAQAINGLAILNSADGPILRLSYQADIPKNANKTHKYKGISTEENVEYFNATTGEQLTAFNDKDYALWLAQTYRATSATTSTSPNAIMAEQVRHFGMGYDFRNKRLPVWRVTLDDAQNSQVFIDTQSGVLADHNTASSRLESLSFSMLHKWGFLVPLTGRSNRDYVIVFFLGLAFTLTVFGLRLKLKQNRKR